MRELNSVEIAEVSGAGKIQDNATDFFGTAFTHLFNILTPLAGLGYTEEQATTAGKNLGERIGGVIETQLNKFITALSSLVN